MENDEYDAFVRRILAAYTRRVGRGDPDALARMHRLADFLNAEVAEAARALHDDAGYSWTEIATRVGITRQAARQRWSA